MKHLKPLISSVLLLALSFAPQAFCQNHRQLHIVSTGDIHGRYFDQPYVEGGSTKSSLMSVSVFVDSLRQAVGKENVLLLDAGDILQGDNASYYFNFVADSTVTHVYPRMAEYMGYDAVVTGNHDLETGHPVYDKVFAELRDRNIPWLGGNVIKEADGGTYFPLYRTFNRAGVKVAVFGFENPNIKAWLPRELYEGMDFLSLVPFAQSMIDYVVKKEKPQVVVAVVHSGTGKGDGSQYENQALDLFNTLKGVDVLIGAHDHRPYTATRQDLVYMDAANNARMVGHAVVDMGFSGKKVVSKDLSVELCNIDANKVDWTMESAFRSDFEAVKAFTNRKIGELATVLDGRGSNDGMCDYMNMLHTVQLEASGADISFSAPLSDRLHIEPRTIIYNDMMELYRFENKMNVIAMKGSEIKSYLEYSYDGWLNGHTPSFNHDSAGGLVYKVDASKPFGERVDIISLAGGGAFEPEAVYNVALTSYRASGGGDIMPKGAGLDADEVESRTVATYESIRDMVQKFFESRDTVGHESISDPSVIGHWEFVNR